MNPINFIYHSLCPHPNNLPGNNKKINPINFICKRHLLLPNNLLNNKKINQINFMYQNNNQLLTNCFQ